jgi:hypothetical protein
MARSTPFGAPWVGFGGGNEDLLPLIPFPWAWASLLFIPLLALLAGLFTFWRRGRNKRAWHHAQRAFQHAWPPKSKDRPRLDEAHAKGRELLAARLGDAAKAWGVSEFQSHNLTPWDQWVKSLDAARFGRSDPPFPSLDVLLNTLNVAVKAKEREKA